MNWFKKSIAYDQKRKIKMLSIIMIIPVILNSFIFWSRITDSKMMKIPVNINDFSLMYIVFIFMSAIIALTSIGIREKSERNYIPSMPMKRYHVVLTKLSCANISFIVPLILGFLLHTIIYISNIGFLTSEGYPYLDIVQKHLFTLLLGIIVINILFLISVMYNNIKVPTVLAGVGILSFMYVIIILSECFEYTSPIRRFIRDVGSTIYNIIFFIRDKSEIYYFNSFGKILILVGIAVLLYVIIDFLASRVNNDIYDNLFPFKVSRLLSSVALVLAISSIIGIGVSILMEVIVYNPIFNIDLGKNSHIIINRIYMGIIILSMPFGAIIARRINKKLEERF